MRRERDAGLCEYNKLRRTRYFHGMLLDEKDFETEQSYHMAKRRLLNRTLHGSGVVCGLGLEWKPESRSLRVEPGLALDCLGNEIWVCDPYTVDLEKLLEASGSGGRGDPCSRGTASDPCAELEEEDGTIDRWLCIRWTETPSDPVPTYASDDCTGQTCDFSRWKEGYCFELLDACPAPERGEGLLEAFCECGPGQPPCGEAPADCPEVDCTDVDEKDRNRCLALAAFCATSPPCPGCRTCGRDEHCVVLGRLELDRKGRLVNACINDCRAYVLTGPLLRHLAHSLFDGIEGWATLEDGEAIPPISRFVENPIHGLCWLIRRFALERDGWHELVPPWIRDAERTEEGERCLGEREEEPDREVVLRQISRKMEELPDVDEELNRIDQRLYDRVTKDSFKSEVGDLKSDFETRVAELEERLAALEEQ